MTAQQIKAGFQVVLAVAETIQELGSVPSGHLYAQLMGVMSLADYQAIIDSLERSKLILIKNHLITWIGPPKR